jgi:hypothetical protein
VDDAIPLPTSGADVIYTDDDVDNTERSVAIVDVPQPGTESFAKMTTINNNERSGDTQRPSRQLQ